MNHSFNILPKEAQDKILEICGRVNQKRKKNKEIDLVKLKQEELRKRKYGEPNN